MTGASGIQYGLRLLECLLESSRPVYLMISKAARAVFALESDVQLPGRTRDAEAYLTDKYHARSGQLRIFGAEEWTAPVASGSSAPGAMVVCPCSMSTLSAIAVGASNQLITRAADVVLKERRLLIVVPRETPLSVVHLRNMVTLAELGAVVMPANPAFYHHPNSIADVIDFIVARILDHLSVPHTLMKPWGIEDSNENETQE
jgi:4-hydroxy-3-polyprenylbenzoate decarboxylase